MCCIREYIFISYKYLQSKFRQMCVNYFHMTLVDDTLLNELVNTINYHLKRVNKFYICNEVHNINTLNKYLKDSSFKTISFTYKGRRIMIDRISNTITINYFKTIDIILGDISLDYIESEF